MQNHPPRRFNENRNTVEKALRRERSLFTSGKCINLLANQERLLCRDGSVKSDNFQMINDGSNGKNYFIVFYVRKTAHRQIEIHLQRKDHRIMS